MWKSLQIDNTLYMIKLETNPVKFLLTDLKELWLEEVETVEISQRFKELNPLLNSSDILNELKGLYDNLTNDCIKIQHVENRMLVDLEGVVDNFKIKFKWELNKNSNDLFFKEITLNLISTVVALEKRQDELFHLLEKKDKEKYEYIREYGEISRDFLKTVKFNKDEFVGESSKSGMFGVFSNQLIIDNLKNQYGANIEKRKAVTDDKQVKKVKQYLPKFLKRPITK